MHPPLARMSPNVTGTAGTWAHAALIPASPVLSRDGKRQKTR